MLKPARQTSSQTTISCAFITCEPLLKRFLARFFSEQRDIEDVAQEAYLRAFAAERRKKIARPKAYLFRVAKNIALTELTKKSKQITTCIEDMDASLVIENTVAENSVDAVVEALDSLELYCEAIATLSEKCRMVFLLRKVRGLTHREIAARMSLSVSSVEKYLATAVLALRQLVNEREGEGCRESQAETERRRKAK